MNRSWIVFVAIVVGMALTVGASFVGLAMLQRTLTQRHAASRHLVGPSAPCRLSAMGP